MRNKERLTGMSDGNGLFAVLYRAGISAFPRAGRLAAKMA